MHVTNFDNSPSVLICGRLGQLAKSFAKLKEPNWQILGRPHLDFCNLSELGTKLKELRPRLIVNTAAFTNVEKAETQKSLSYQINSEAPKFLAQYCFENNASLIHFSSDFVYSGAGESPWKEDQAEMPVNFYGESKLLGEQFIVESGCRYFIFRTSWLYSSYGANFVKTVMRLATLKSEIQIVDDQIGAPTSAFQLAKSLVPLIKQESFYDSRIAPPGIYNLSSQGATSRFDFAQSILRENRKLFNLAAEPKLIAISSHQMPSLARRPLNSRLDLSKAQQALGLQLPDWQTDLSQTIADIGSSLS